jgi:limonene-1,2-epoxide hydrolase
VYRGHHGKVPVVGVVEVEQGQVKAWREYYDRAQMIEALGLQQDFDATQRR